LGEKINAPASRHHNIGPSIKEDRGGKTSSVAHRNRNHKRGGRRESAHPATRPIAEGVSKADALKKDKEKKGENRERTLSNSEKKLTLKNPSTPIYER